MFQYNQDGDGIDHINCYSKGATLLGRMMSNFYKSKFIFDGKEYYTMEHFWYTHYIEFILNKFPERIQFIDFSNADSIESDLDSMRKIDGYSVKLRCEDLIKDLTMNNNGVSGT